MTQRPWAPCGISHPFEWLSPTQGQVTHVLLTRLPLYSPARRQAFALDLHVLGTPPAFVLSQDQTLQFNPSHTPARCVRSHTQRSNRSVPFAIRFSKIDAPRPFPDGASVQFTHPPRPCQPPNPPSHPKNRARLIRPHYSVVKREKHPPQRSGQRRIFPIRFNRGRWRSGSHDQ